MTEQTIRSHHTGELRQQIIDLAPWHLDVEVAPGLSTAVSLEDLPADAPKLSFLAPRESWHNQIKSIYPQGLAGRSFLDCACNCGGYSFWSKELGAEECYAFDARDHWINQARFLQEARGDTDGITFEVRDVYDMANDPRDFDVTLFKGIFYHLPDPITALQAVADRTRELLIFNTATRAGLPDGMLAVDWEPVEHPMSGVHGLNWFPTGPEVIEHIVNYMGFPATRLTFWKRGEDGGLGRIEVMAARDEATFQHYDARRP